MVGKACMARYSNLMSWVLKGKVDQKEETKMNVGDIIKGNCCRW